MPRKLHWPRKLASGIFFYRYIICVLIIVFIVVFGLYLYLYRDWIFKDVVQVCSSFFIVLTLFFAALNYEFSSNKMRADAKSAKEILTYNVAAEWHKAPIKDYQKSVIEFEKKFRRTSADKTIDGFQTFIEDEENLDFKESLKGILNYFETFSIAAYEKVIDAGFIKLFHYSIFCSYYIDYKVYIDHRRTLKNNPAIWQNFTKLAEEWSPGIDEKVKDGVLKSTVID